MHRVFVPPEAVRGDRISVTTPDDLHHLVRVLRAKAGERIECMDGAGGRYEGVIARCSPRELLVDVQARRRDAPENAPLTLAVALVKAERFEWMLQKATELGVARFVPLVTSRTVARTGREGSARKQPRWQRIIQEAALQCGRAAAPVLEEPQRFSRFVSAWGDTPWVLMPTLVEPTVPLRQALEALPAAGAVVVLIGPEGDFTPEETQAARHAGARLVSLGRRTLRTETAAITVTAVIQQALGELG